MTEGKIWRDGKRKMENRRVEMKERNINFFS